MTAFTPDEAQAELHQLTLDHLDRYAGKEPAQLGHHLRESHSVYVAFDSPGPMALLTKMHAAAHGIDAGAQTTSTGPDSAA